MATPAEEFAELLTGRLTGRAAAAQTEAPAAPPTPRLPAPNAAQGSSGIAAPPRPSGADVLADALADLGAPRGDAGWRQL
jgi:hypothetical protein